MVPQVYDKNMKRLAYLENAIAVSYDLTFNSLWTASFTLPARDPKNRHCQQFNFIELFDGNRRIDLFRIIGEDFTRSDESFRYYDCEHVLATLINNVLFQYHQIGGTNVRTPAVLNYVLNHQSTKRWKLDLCEFSRQFEYNFENENLLSAIFSVPKCFDVAYAWSWDTTVYPWLLSLTVPSDELKSEIRYRKNMTGISKTVDSTEFANRIYALGYGEGVNQLTISSVNNGTPYVEDAGSIHDYGLVETILADGRYEVAANLKAYAEQILAETKEPYISYEVDAIDLLRLTGDKFSLFRPGELIRVLDKEDEITVRTRIVSVAKGDVLGNPGDVKVTLANKSKDIAGSISDLQNRARINETYAQGATNIIIQNFADNADASHPATLKVFIPDSVVRINKMLLNISFESFRAYSQATGGGGAQTTSSGGGATSSSVVLTPSNTQAVDDGGYGASNHNHGVQRDTQLAIVNSNLQIVGSVGWAPSGAHQHDAHTHTVPAHTHGTSDHTHPLTFGIYTGTSAQSMTLKVDGNTVPGATKAGEYDIISYLSTDDSGKITRNAWHTIEIRPNTMSRIVAALFTQLFTNSRGGGDF